MRKTILSLAWACLVGAIGFAWGVYAARDEVLAQRSVPTLTRMFTGPDGLTHFEDVEMPFGQLIKVAGVQFNRSSGSDPKFQDWHPAPNRRYVITLSGKGEIVGAGNQVIIADRDRILLAEDLTGKGHITRGMDWVTLFVELDQP